MILIVELLLCVVIAIILVGVIQQFVFSAVNVEGSSMMPTIKDDGESKAYILKTYKQINRNDVVVFYRPNAATDEVNPSERSVTITEFFKNLPIIGKKMQVGNENDTSSAFVCVIKRVVAVAGDKIQVIDGYFYIQKGGSGDWDKLTDFDSVEFNPLNMTTSAKYGVADSAVITVGEDELYVLGDNRNNSYDSEDYGCIKTSWIYGKAAFLYTDGNYGKVG